MSASAVKPLPEPRPLPGFGRVALFLDLDGTLAAIRPRPEDVGPEPWRTALMQRLEERLAGKLAVISGRSVEEVDRILEGSVAAVGGVHGLVRRRSDGVVDAEPAAPGMDAARQRLASLLAQHPGLRIEDKGLSLAIHYRQAPELESEVGRHAEAIAAETGLSLQLGDMVAELRTPGVDKGAAVKAFMREPPFKGAVPVFVGDDLTDEHGFRAARALGGLGVLVGPLRATGADMRLESVDAVRQWLETSLMQDARP